MSSSMKMSNEQKWWN